MEDALNARQEAAGKPERLWLTAKRRPLREAVTEGDPTLFGIGADGCDSGYCFT